MFHIVTREKHSQGRPLLEGTLYIVLFYNFSTFSSEFDSHMESIINNPGHLVITGDFNIHLHDTHNLLTF